ncbi:hypothetical protein PanWU01x14_266080 [Parasponia andersonii]|uniref:DUF1262 family protein n=1 Tax=Parasponia andersonii TaxID=3476 RepID=A0A2P5B6V0_PARAD|nr:hypothetical protein PanWU01x14_266080 [Parasponia andersonii]
MYVTRPLSMYKKYPSALSLPPPEGPNSGILVIQDEAAEPRHFFGLFKGHQLKDLPFPQNKDLKLRYSYSTGAGENSHQHVSRFYANFIPVLNQPLSSNRYYVIRSDGSHKGEACTNSTPEDIETCCFCNFVREVKPKPLHPQDIYQQFEILRKRRFNQIGAGFVAKSVAPDGFPPKFLARKGWEVYTSTPDNFHLEEASGINTSLRSRLPEFDFPLVHTAHSIPVVVGKWYCPFMFIKEGSPKEQMRRSMYYQMTLEQRWEQIYSCEVDSSKEDDSAVSVDISIQREVVMVSGNEVTNVESDRVNGVVWFRSLNKVGGETCLGLSLEIVERMEWEQKGGGWIRGNEGKVRVKKVEEYEVTKNGWRRFGCYVLVERFVLRRMDGSLVLVHDFRHTHHIRSKWE